VAATRPAWERTAGDPGEPAALADVAGESFRNFLEGELPQLPGEKPTMKDVVSECPIEEAMVLLRECYVHLELKRAMHAVEPLQRLRLLRYRLTQPEGAALSDLEFHHEMSSIFASVRDLHTNYLLPAPYREQTAFLPFLVEECFESVESFFRSPVSPVLCGVFSPSPAGSPDLFAFFPWSVE
jgi:hypothetical protein